MKSFSCLISLFCISVSSVFSQEQERGGKAKIDLTPIKGNVYALIVGVSDYQSPLINDLRYAASDARAVADYLKSAPINRKLIIELYDSVAKRSNIREKGLQKIDNLVFNHVIKEDDFIIVYLSGHGGAFNKTDSYFFPHDAVHTQDAGSSFPISRIKGYIRSWSKESKATVLFIFDACRSATIVKGQEDFDLNEVSRYLEEDTGEILMAASRGGKPAQETSELRHGVFSFYLLEGLYGKADITGDHQISINELEKYVNDNVTSKTKLSQSPMVKYPALMDGKIIATVKPELLALVDQRLQLDLSNSAVVQLAQRGASENTKALELSELISKFNQALKEGKLVKPADNCAYFYYQQMSKLAPVSSLEDYLTDLTIALYDAALSVVKHDLNGERLYLIPNLAQGGSRSKKGYDLNYYKDASINLKTYVELKKQVMPKGSALEPIVNAMLQYLEGRDLTIQFLEGDSKDSRLSRSSIKVFKTAVEQHSTQPFLWQGLAMAYLEDPKIEYLEAERAAKQALALAPHWSYPLVTLGEIAMYQDKDKEGANYFNKALQVNSKDITPYFLLGFLEPDSLKALSFYKLAYQVDSTSVVTNYNLGLGYYYAEKNDSAKLYFDKVIRQNPVFYEVYYYSAQVNHELGFDSLAIEHYKLTIRNPECDPCAFINLGVILADKGYHKEAIAMYNEAIKKDPLKALAYHNLANSLFDLDDYTGSELNYKKALRLDATYKDTYRNYGALLVELDRYPEAIEVFQQYLKFDRETAGVYRGLGQAKLHLRQFTEAEIQFKRAIELDPDDAYNFYWYGMLLSDLGKTEESINQFKRAIVLQSNDEDLYYQLARVFRKVGRYKEAIYTLEKAIQLNPADGWNYYYLGETYRKLEQNTESIDFYNKALERSSDDLSLKAYSLLRLGKLRDAEDIFKKKIKDRPNEGNSYYEYACFLTLNNRLEESLGQLKLAIERGYNDWNWMEVDEDLFALRLTSGYKALIAGFKK